MATTATLTNVGDKYPTGTVVTATVLKTGSGWSETQGRRGGGSVASPITGTAAVVAGAQPRIDVPFTGLTASTRYLATAVINSVPRYCQFFVD